LKPRTGPPQNTAATPNTGVNKTSKQVSTSKTNHATKEELRLNPSVSQQVIVFDKEGPGTWKKNQSQKQARLLNHLKRLFPPREKSSDKDKEQQEDLHDQEDYKGPASTPVVSGSPPCPLSLRGQKERTPTECDMEELGPSSSADGPVVAEASSSIDEGAQKETENSAPQAGGRVEVVLAKDKQEKEEEHIDIQAERSDKSRGDSARKSTSWAAMTLDEEEGEGRNENFEELSSSKGQDTIRSTSPREKGEVDVVVETPPKQEVAKPSTTGDGATAEESSSSEDKGNPTTSEEVNEVLKEVNIFEDTGPTEAAKSATTSPTVDPCRGEDENGKNDHDEPEVVQEASKAKVQEGQEQKDVNNSLLAKECASKSTSAQLGKSPRPKVVVFVEQPRDAMALAWRLTEGGYKVADIHRTRADRHQLITQFKNGKLDILVTTTTEDLGDCSVTDTVLFELGPLMEEYIKRVNRAASNPSGRGHALVFFEYSDVLPDHARRLIKVLEEAQASEGFVVPTPSEEGFVVSAVVPAELYRIADEVKAGKRVARNKHLRNSSEEFTYSTEFNYSTKKFNSTSTEEVTSCRAGRAGVAVSSAGGSSALTVEAQAVSETQTTQRTHNNFKVKPLFQFNTNKKPLLQLPEDGASTSDSFFVSPYSYNGQWSNRGPDTTASTSHVVPPPPPPPAPIPVACPVVVLDQHPLRSGSKRSRKNNTFQTQHMNKNASSSTAAPVHMSPLSNNIMSTTSALNIMSTSTSALNSALNNNASSSTTAAQLQAIPNGSQEGQGQGTAVATPSGTTPVVAGVPASSTTGTHVATSSSSYSCVPPEEVVTASTSSAANNINVEMLVGNDNTNKNNKVIPVRPNPYNLGCPSSSSNGVGPAATASPHFFSPNAATMVAGQPNGVVGPAATMAAGPRGGGHNRRNRRKGGTKMGADFHMCGHQHGMGKEHHHQQDHGMGTNGQRHNLMSPPHEIVAMYEQGLLGHPQGHPQGLGHPSRSTP
ncbi:unnamed protein product, partial [Amoebophrya sp. A25]